MKGNTKMKLKYNLFGCIPTTHEIEGFSICVTSYREKDSHGSQSWTIAATYFGALYKGWQLARMYASLEGLDQHIFIYRGVDFMRTDGPISIRMIRVTKKVAFFTK